MPPGLFPVASAGSPVLPQVAVSGGPAQPVAQAPVRSVTPPGLAAAFAGLHPAGVGLRIAAFTIDALAVAIASIVVFLVSRNGLLAALAAAELSVGLVVWEANRGRTVGNTILRLRTTRVEQPRNAGPIRALVRALVVFAGLLVAAIGAWVIVASSGWGKTGRGQGWHDRAGRTVTLRLPAGKRTRTSRVQSATIGTTSSPRVNNPQVGARASAATSAASTNPAAVPIGSVPAGFVSSVGSVPAPTPEQPALFTSATQADPAALAAEEADRASDRARAIEYVSPTVISTRLVIEEPDDDSLAESGPTPPPAGAPTAIETPTIDRIRFMLFAFDTGQQVRVATPGTGVIGRNPRVFTEGDQLIAIDDPAKSMSKSHLLYQVSGAAVQVLDHSSTNGSEIIDDEGVVERLEPGVWTPVAPGSRVRVGQRVFTISVVDAS